METSQPNLMRGLLPHNGTSYAFAGKALESLQVVEHGPEIWAVIRFSTGIAPQILSRLAAPLVTIVSA